MKLGELKFGELKEATIEFINTGTEDLKIEFVQGGCSCTEPTSWSRKAIAPGQKGYVKIKFDSSLADIKKGYESAVEIYGNVEDDLLLYYISADIVK